MPEEIPLLELSRGERTRAEVVRVAYRLFLENGYHGTSMRQIAQAASLAVGGIYNHFDSKEAIFVEVLLNYHPIHSVLPHIKAAQGKTIDGFVRDAAWRMVGDIDERLEFINLIFIELVEFKSSHVPQLVEIIYPQIIDFARRFVEEREELRPIPAPILARAFVGLFFSFIMTELLLAHMQPSSIKNNALDHFVDIFLHGILKGELGVQAPQANSPVSDKNRETDR